VSTQTRAQKHRRGASTRVNLRIEPGIKATLVKAAKLKQVKLTQFMVQASQTAAEIALADRTRFILSPEKWREFNVALDAAPREIPALRALFSEPEIFE
jgi:uncharacterized protein (DUF1778 family)